MANSKLLKEAIADAKAVKETALANAKLALEEAFTPRLQSILSQKLRAEAEAQEDDAEHTHWRDPWVFFDERDNKWHMLNTADIKSSTNKKICATVAHSTSTDLKTWEVQPPLHGESGFGQVEVIQVEEIDGKWVLVFSVNAHDLNEVKPGWKSTKS